jgi:hypothetical protein
VTQDAPRHPTLGDGVSPSRLGVWICSYLVGHANLATTSRYVRLSEESGEAALALVSRPCWGTLWGRRAKNCGAKRGLEPLQE